MAAHAAKKTRSYDWDDYRTWDDDKRWELVGGEAFDMTPAPGTGHQRAVLRLAAELHRYFTGKTCEVFVAPVDVKLSDEDIVQPDIVVVCERSKLKPTHIEGAPTLVVEVLSPSTEVHDRLRKMALYARTGVKEVWLVSPEARLVELFVLDGATYRLTGTYTQGDSLRSRAFPKLSVNLRNVFTLPPEAGTSVRMLRETGPSYGSRPTGHARRPVRKRPAPAGSRRRVVKLERP